MEETKKNVSEPEKSKTGKAKKEDGFSLNKWYAAHKAEYKRISWPTRQEVVRQTVIVLVLCFVMGALIFGIDTGLTKGYDALMSLVAA